MTGKNFDLDTCFLVSLALGDQIAGMHVMLSELAKERLRLLERRSPGFEQACEWVKDSRSPALHGAISRDPMRIDLKPLLLSAADALDPVAVNYI